MKDYIEGLKHLTEIHVIPYSHHDFAWTNTRQWHIWRYTQCFSEVLDVMRTNKDITWLIDNVTHSLMPFMKYCPEKLEELKMRVKEGRIYIANGGVSLARPDYIGDESYVRNMTEGRKCFKSLFGIDNIDFFFNADTAGGHSQMPQVLKLGGHEYYMFYRPEEALDRQGVPRQFVWRGLDGSEVIVSRSNYGGFMDGKYINKNFETQWEEIRREFYEQDIKDKVGTVPYISDIVLLNYGCDDFRPLRNLNDEPIRIVEFIEEWNKREKSKIFFSTPGDFFKKLSQRDIPVHEGTLDPCEMTFNTPIKGGSSMWRMRYELDRLIVKAEAVSVISALMGSDYPEKRIRSLWNGLFEITGHAIEWVLKDDHEYLYTIASNVKNETKLLIREACEDIACRLQVEDGEQYAVINTTNWNRREMVKLHITSPFGISGFDLLDNAGNRLEYQVTEYFGGDKRYIGYEYGELGIVADIETPSIGYMTLRTVRNGDSIKEKTEKECKIVPGVKRQEIMGKTVINNGAMEVVLDDGHICEIKDLSSGRSITAGMAKNGTSPVSIGGPGFVRTEHTDSWISSWNTVIECIMEPEKCEILENGPLRWVYRITGRIGGNRFKQDMTICRGVRAVDFDLEIDSLGEEGYFIADFPSDTDTDIYADIPFGVEKREPDKTDYGIGRPGANLAERGWPGQFYAKSWASFSSGGMPAAIVSGNCSIYYRHDPGKNTVSLLLNRNMPLSGKTDPWVTKCHPSMDGCGKHNYKYSLLLHESNERFADIARYSKEKAQPLEVVPKFNSFSKESAALWKSFINVGKENIIISAFFMEDGKYILRLFETDGVKTTAEIDTGFVFKTVNIVDFNGDRIEDAKYSADRENNKVAFDIAPWQIINFEFVL